MTICQLSIDQCAALARKAFSDAPERRVSDLSFYLAHVVSGRSMRAVARETDVQPSTVMRAVRRVENMRDDPLIDRALSELETNVEAEAADLDALPQGNVAHPHDRPSLTLVTDPEEMKDPSMKNASSVRSASNPAAPTREEFSALSRLAEPEAFLMVATGAERAGVFCAKNQFRRPLALIPLDGATKFLTNDWVRCVTKTNLSAKYGITEAGRAAIRRHIASEGPPRAVGHGEVASPFSDQHQLAGERRIANFKTGEIETIRVNLGESPLGWLAKRKDANGQPLLTSDEVEAGERLREDFEMAQIGPRMGQDWRRFLTPASHSSSPGRTPSEGPMFARDRVASAVEVLGPGLSDAAIRICCFLEGLEATERRMGWSARSGKVVLKLALQRLVDHYGLRSGPRKAA